MGLVMKRRLCYVVIAAVLSFFDRLWLDLGVPLWVDLLKFIVLVLLFELVLFMDRKNGR